MILTHIYGKNEEKLENFLKNNGESWGLKYNSQTYSKCQDIANNPMGLVDQMKNVQNMKNPTQNLKNLLLVKNRKNLSKKVEHSNYI